VRSKAVAEAISGASRLLRDEQGKKNTPCIIFINEINATGR